MAPLKKYLIPYIDGDDSLGYNNNQEYFIEKCTFEGKEGFYGAHGTGVITGAYFTIELAEEALLAELQKRIVRQSVKVTKRAADLTKLAFDLSNNGFKGYRADP
jgi:hypothetical protein